MVGDTVGDPFKDTSGPALNILIKLMSMVSLTVVSARINTFEMPTKPSFAQPSPAFSQHPDEAHDPPHSGESPAA